MRRQLCLLRSPTEPWLLSLVLVAAWIFTTASATSLADPQATHAATSESTGRVMLAGAMSIDVNSAAEFATDPAVKLAIINSISALIGAPSTCITGLAINGIGAGRRLVSGLFSLFAWRRLSSSGTVLVTYLVTLPADRPDIDAMVEAFQTSSAGAIAALIDAEIGEAIGHGKYSVSVLSMDTMVLSSQSSHAAAENEAETGDASGGSVLTVSLLSVLGFSSVVAAFAIGDYLRRSNRKNRASQETDCASSGDDGKCTRKRPVVLDEDDSFVSSPRELQVGKVFSPPRKLQVEKVDGKAASLPEEPTILQVHYDDAVIMPVLLDSDVVAQCGPTEEELLDDGKCDIVPEIDERQDVEAIDAAIPIEPDVNEDFDLVEFPFALRHVGDPPEPLAEGGGEACGRRRFSV